MSIIIPRCDGSQHHFRIDHKKYVNDPLYIMALPRVYLPKAIIERDDYIMANGLCHPSNANDLPHQRNRKLVLALERSFKWWFKKNYPFGTEKQWFESDQRTGFVRIRQELDMLGLPYEAKSVLSTIIYFYVTQKKWKKLRPNQIFSNDTPDNLHERAMEKFKARMEKELGIPWWNITPSFKAELMEKAPKQRFDATLRDKTANELREHLEEKFAAMIDHAGPDHGMAVAWRESGSLIDGYAIDEFGSAFPQDEMRRKANAARKAKCVAKKKALKPVLTPEEKAQRKRDKAAERKRRQRALEKGVPKIVESEPEPIAVQQIPAPEPQRNAWREGVDAWHAQPMAEPAVVDHGAHDLSSLSELIQMRDWEEKQDREIAAAEEEEAERRRREVKEREKILEALPF